MHKYLVRYTNKQGERKTFGNNGFDSLEDAQKEIDRISYMNLRNVRIKKISAIVHDLIFAK